MEIEVKRESIDGYDAMVSLRYNLYYRSVDNDTNVAVYYLSTIRKSTFLFTTSFLIHMAKKN